MTAAVSSRGLHGTDPGREAYGRSLLVPAAPVQTGVVEWATRYPCGEVGASLAEVEPSGRVRAASALAGGGLVLHADAVLDDRGRSRGVAWTELAEVRDELPSALVDLHAVVVGGPGPGQQTLHLQRCIQAATYLGCVRLVVGARDVERHRRRLRQLQLRGTEVWVHLPGSTDVDTGLKVDGVVLTARGDEHAATDAGGPDKRVLGAVECLRRRFPVGVEGATGRSDVEAYRRAGASLVVADGRLLTTNRVPSVTPLVMPRHPPRP